MDVDVQVDWMDGHRKYGQPVAPVMVERMEFCVGHALVR